MCLIYHFNQDALCVCVFVQIKAHFLPSTSLMGVSVFHLVKPHLFAVVFIAKSNN